VTDDVTRTRKVKVVSPISLKLNISKTVWDGRSVQISTCRKPHIASPMVTWLMTSRDPKRSRFWAPNLSTSLLLSKISWLAFWTQLKTDSIHHNIRGVKMTPTSRWCNKIGLPVEGLTVTSAVPSFCVRVGVSRWVIFLATITVRWAVVRLAGFPALLKLDAAGRCVSKQHYYCVISCRCLLP